MVLICISLITSGVEYHFLCLPHICLSSLEEVSSQCLYILDEIGHIQGGITIDSSMFKNWVVYSLTIELQRICVYSALKSLIGYIIYRYLCPIWKSVVDFFHFLNSVL